MYLFNKIMTSRKDLKVYLLFCCQLSQLPAESPQRPRQAPAKALFFSNNSSIFHLWKRQSLLSSEAYSLLGLRGKARFFGLQAKKAKLSAGVLCKPGLALKMLKPHIRRQ
jgi:hypothetical protein